MDRNNIIYIVLSLFETLNLGFTNLQIETRNFMVVVLILLRFPPDQELQDSIEQPAR